MRIAIIAQEEPVYFSPFLSRVIDRIPEAVVAVAIAGSRGAGSHPKTLRQKLENIYVLWLIMEPRGFVRNLCIGLFQKLRAVLGPRANAGNRRSIIAAAARHAIPVVHVPDINAAEFIQKLAQFQPDVIVNQSELLIKEGLLRIPKSGVLNRHASLLPRFRGRLGSWWSHAAEPPEYGVTIHFVDRGIDSGPIIVQKKYDIDPRSSYAEVLDRLFQDADSLLLEALERLRSPGFKALPNEYEGTKTYLFPTLDEVKTYRAVLKERRRGA